MIRKVCLTLVLCCLSFQAASAQSQDWARKLFEANSHNFGTVPRGSDPQYVFKIKNPFKEDVHISNVRASCGCITVKKVEPATLKTFDEGSILIQFNTQAFVGQKNATVTVQIDQPFFAEVQLAISGFIRTDIMVNPGAVDFGTVEHGAKIDKKVRIQSFGRSNWQITAIETSSQNIEAEAVEVSRANGRVEYDMTVRVTNSAPIGYLQESIKVLTNDDKGDGIPIHVQGHIDSELSVRPSPLFLGVFTPGNDVTKSIIVKGRRPFQIQSMECENKATADSFEFSGLGKGAQTVHAIQLKFTAPDLAGRIVQRVLIETDNGMTAELMVYAQVVGGQAGRAEQANKVSSDDKR